MARASLRRSISRLASRDFRLSIQDQQLQLRTYVPTSLHSSPRREQDLGSPSGGSATRGLNFRMLLGPSCGCGDGGWKGKRERGREGERERGREGERERDCRLAEGGEEQGPWEGGPREGGRKGMEEECRESSTPLPSIRLARLLRRQGNNSKAAKQRFTRAPRRALRKGPDLRFKVDRYLLCRACCVPRTSSPLRPTPRFSS
jgi:hypothetical protein